MTGNEFNLEAKTCDAFFAAYWKLNGRVDRKTFDRNREEFFRLTKDAFIHGDGDRDKAWAAWVEYVGSECEAIRYFTAIDRVTPYT